MPETANNSSARARQLGCPTIGVRQVRPEFVGYGEGIDNRGDIR